MKRHNLFYLPLLILSLLSGCKDSPKSPILDSEKLLSFDINTVEDKEYEVKLSDLTESIEIIRMDNSTIEAYTGIYKVFVSEHLFATCKVDYPVKLFRRKDGKFLGNIGQPGQGPGEYFLIWHVVIDEPRRRIYLVNNQKKDIYSYDFRGNYHPEEAIYFPQNNGLWCGAVFLDRKEDKAIVFQTPDGTYDRGDVHLEATKHICWVQDFKGNIIQSIPAKRFETRRGNSNKIWASHIDPQSPIYTYGIDNLDSKRTDTIYHYNMLTNETYPVYTTNIPTRWLSIVTSKETPLYYYTKQQRFQPNTEINPQYNIGQKFLQVDKQTGKGRYIRLVNDYLGGIEIALGEWIYHIIDDYTICCLEPLELKEQLEEVLESNKDMSDEVRKRVINLKETLHENDNNIMIICKFKKQ